MAAMIGQPASALGLSRRPMPSSVTEADDRMRVLEAAARETEAREAAIEASRLGGSDSSRRRIGTRAGNHNRQ
ncbi:MAG: hypothetical protein SFW09_10270 [Hyphomicrobiaceae bacterium]|nr:hypothetical protein [Hyphomicrobiaceae bacterium]